jgi:hypothetical protein
MAQPQAYNRETDFTERDGDDTNHPGINTELDAAAQSINEIRNNLALIQRDDGALQNGIVTAESLAPTAFDAFKGDLNEAAADAQTAATSANNAALSANTARDQAVAAKDTAVTSANAAALNATTATTKAAEAAASATAAATSATASGSSASASQTSRLASEAARDASQAAQAAAAASQTATATSEANASASAATATAQAGIATTQAGIATTQASNAATSATAAAASFDQFDDRYLGSKTADPTVDNDGNPLLTGALYFNSVAGEMRVWADTFWKATGSSVGGTINTAKYTATAGQTTFAIVYDVGFVHVYLNGLKLESGAEFTANNGTSVVLATGATAGDVVDMIAFGIFSVANTYTKAEADALLAAKANQAAVDAALATKQAADAELSTLAGMSSSRATFLASAEGFGFRNRIINGDMRIDQRNAGASVTVNGNFQYPVDRMIVGGVASAGTFTAQQTATAPAGFTKAFVCTTGTADAAIAAGDYYFPLLHRVEGLNTSDFGFGSASAQTITVSFWVRSNVTGTYPVALRNSGASRSYVATFTINSANTFEYKTVTIPGDTSGTWLTDNGIGIDLSIGAIGGSAAQTSAGAWVAGNFYTTSACTNWMATTGNTFYITGVQLEAGSVATPFERRDYGRELMMCQRYYQNVNYGATWYTGNTGVFIDMEDRALGGPQFFVPMRVTPTVYLTADGGATQSVRSYGGDALRSVGGISVTQFGVASITHGTPYTLGRPYTATWKAEAEL